VSSPVKLVCGNFSPDAWWPRYAEHLHPGSGEAWNASRLNFAISVGAQPRVWA
jgi:hypothetical protein